MLEAVFLSASPDAPNSPDLRDDLGEVDGISTGLRRRGARSLGAEASVFWGPFGRESVGFLFFFEEQKERPMALGLG